MPESNFQIEKFARGLCDYISEVDRKRPYKKGIIPKLYFASNERSYFVRNNPKLYKKTRRDLDPFFKRLTKLDYVDNIIFIIIGVLFLLVTIEGVVLFLRYRSIFFIVAIFIVDVICFFVLFIISMNRRRRIAGEIYNKEISKIVQELINYGAELFKEKKLNPEDFPIELKHEDYKDLTYKNEGKNYNAYLVIK